MYQKSKPKLFKTFYRGIPLAQHREQRVFTFNKAWNLTKYVLRDGEESELKRWIVKLSPTPKFAPHHNQNLIGR